MNPRVFFAAFFVLLLAVPCLAVVGQSSMKIFAVTTEGNGLSADLILNINDGSGKVWSSVVPLVGTTTQNAETVAVNLAKSYASGVDSHDYLFEIKSDASVVEGPSAGSAMALLVVSALKDKRIPKEVGLTGTISEDGSIGPVGGVFEKSKEAARIGIKLFMIPKGEAKQTIKLPDSVQSISLPDYALEEWDMKVVEVSNLDEALKLAFSDIGKIDVNASQAEPELIFTPSPIAQASSLQPLQKYTKKYLAETKELIASARNSLSTTLITDNSIINSLLMQLGDTESALSEAQALYDSNYLYSAANYAFLARVNAMTIKDIAENPSIVADNSSALNAKVEALKEKVKSLEDEIDKGIPVEGFEWYAAAQQRVIWARVNLERLSQPATVIVINGIQQDSTETALQNVQDFEFASEWYNIASNFYEFGSEESTKWAALNGFAKEALSAEIVKAENSLSVMPAFESEDVLRRLNSAKVEKEYNWTLGGYFDALSANALIAAEKEVEGKDSNQLESELEAKIRALDSRINDLNFKPVWANLYLDHARYFLNGARFYRENSQTARSFEMLKSGISLSLLAESNIEAAQKSFAHYSVIADSELVKTPARQPSAPANSGIGVNVSIVPENEFMYYLVIILIIGLILAIILILLILARKHSSEVREYRTLTEEQRKLARDYSEGKITAEEFLSGSGRLSQNLGSLEGRAVSKSRHTADLDYLHSKAAVIESSLRQLKRSYLMGKILESDYNSVLLKIAGEIRDLDDSLRVKDAPSAKAQERPVPSAPAKEESTSQKRQSAALSAIAREINMPAKRKPAKKAAGKKKKRR